MNEKLEKQKERLVEELANTNPATKDYTIILENLAKLNEKETHKFSFGLSRDTIFNGLVTVGSIVLLAKFEDLRMLNQKAFSRVPKIR